MTRSRFNSALVVGDSGAGPVGSRHGTAFVFDVTTSGEFVRTIVDSDTDDLRFASTINVNRDRIISMERTINSVKYFGATLHHSNGADLLSNYLAPLPAASFSRVVLLADDYVVLGGQGADISHVFRALNRTSDNKNSTALSAGVSRLSQLNGGVERNLRDRHGARCE